MVQRYPYSTRWEKSIVAIIHIYRALAIFLLFCDHQDTYSESCEMEIGVSELILAQKKETSLWDNDIHTLLDG